MGRTAVAPADLDGLAIPEGGTLCFSPYALGRDPHSYANFEHFSVSAVELDLESIDFDRKIIAGCVTLTVREEALREMATSGIDVTRFLQSKGHHGMAGMIESGSQVAPVLE